MSRWLSWGVHAYTALGAPIALITLAAIHAGNARAAFLWMSLALFIDSTDGVLARTVRVKQVIQSFDGARLDDIVDYITYTLVPMVFAVRFEMLPAAAAIWIASLPLVASAYGFSQTAAKTEDFFFTGFPSLWNVVVYYLFALGIPPAMNALTLVVLSVLVFVPIRYLHPLRNPFLRGPTIGFGTVWALAMLSTMFQLPEPSLPTLWLSLAFPAWYLSLSLYLNVRPLAAKTP